MFRCMLSVRLGELRMKQAELARKTGIRKETINELYNELTDRVNLVHIYKICKALDCELSELIVDEETLDPKLLKRLSKRIPNTK